MQFRKKPVVIAAVLFDGTLASLEALAIPEVSQDLGSKTAQIPTLEGVMTAQPGDWIIRGVKGEFYPCKPDIFAATYEAAEGDAPPSARIVGGVAMADQFDFGLAVHALKSGERVARAGWNGKGMFVYLVPANSYPAQTGAAKAFFGEGGLVPYNAYLALKGADNTVSTWAPSGSDALAEDWLIVE